MAERPIPGVSEGIPEDVRGDAGEYGEHDEPVLRRRAERRRGRVEWDSAANGCGKPGPERLFRVSVEEPEGDEAERQIEKEDAGESMPESSVDAEACEVWEVGTEGADDDCGDDETGAPEGNGSGGVSGSEGHGSIMTCGAGEDLSGGDHQKWTLARRFSRSRTMP